MISQPEAFAEAENVGRDEAWVVEQFLYLEARLADESRYSEWETLVEHDILYWIPLGQGDFDPKHHVSITYDNRARLANRIQQLKTGRRISQKPPSPMRRVISNVEINRTADGYHVFCNFVLYEHATQASPRLVVWPAQAEYRLRRRPDGGLGIAFKKVSLVNGTGPVPSIPFLL